MNKTHIIGSGTMDISNRIGNIFCESFSKLNSFVINDVEGEDLVVYISEMRNKSDRWATMSQRPFINLETEKVVYKPNWLIKLEKEKVI